ncbi:MAG: SEC-C domain-containing protein [Anaerolineae bacterium]|nr:SEC-C domain-containing protein [Anaerolineae bacterium]
MNTKEMQPAARPNLGRNDPCWCGSGKKYKNCHRDADQEGESRRRQKDALFDALGRFALQRKYEIAFRQAGKLFFGVDRAPAPSDDPEQLKDFQRALDYFIFDSRLAEGTRIIELFADLEGKYLSPLQRKWLDQWQHAVLIPLEVLEVHRGQGVRVRDLLTGEEYEVREQRGSETILRWEIVFMRLMPMDEHYEFGGSGLHLPVSYFGLVHRYLNDLWLEYQLDQPEGTYKEFCHSTSHLINQFILNDIGAGMTRPPLLSTPEGDLMARCRAAYGVLDSSAALQRLRAHAGLDEEKDAEGEGHLFIWYQDDAARALLQKHGPPFVSHPPLAGDASGRRILGDLTLRADTLEINTVSRRRLDAFKELLVQALGAMIRHREDQVASLAEILADTQEDEAGAEDDELELSEPTAPASRAHDLDPAKGFIPVSDAPAELQALAEQYRADYNRRWIDLEIPALHGATPRDAVKTLAGRVRVIRLLKTFEQQQARRVVDAGPRFDWNVISEELGLSQQEFRDEARLEDLVHAKLDKIFEHCINDELDKAWNGWRQFRSEYPLTSVEDIDFGQAWSLPDILDDAVMILEYRLAMFKRFDDAQTLLDEYIALAPDNIAWARVEREVVRAERGEIDDALAALHELANDNDCELEALLERAEIQFNLLNQSDAALETLRYAAEVVEDDEEFERVYDATLELYKNAERYDEGESYWHAQNDDSQDDRDYPGLVRMLLARGDLSRAAEMVERIPGDEMSDYFSGMIAARRGDYASARAFWQNELEEASPDDSLGWHTWGDLHLWLYEPERVLQIDPAEQLHHWKAYWVRALAYAQLGDLDRAHDEAERARLAMETRGRRIHAQHTLQEYRHFARALGLADEALGALTLE